MNADENVSKLDLVLPKEITCWADVFSLYSSLELAYRARMELPPATVARILELAPAAAKFTTVYAGEIVGFGAYYAAHGNNLNQMMAYTTAMNAAAKDATRLAGDNLKKK